MSSHPTVFSANSQQYRAPSGNGEVFALPPLDQAVILAERNAENLQQSAVEIAGMTLAELRRQTRQTVISRAVQWTNRITGSMSACSECAHSASLVFVTGHQPQLAHSGVWVKNFAASSLANSGNGIGLNIIVDNDTVGTQSVRVPTGRREHPSVTSISFDSAHPQQPWEELTILDPQLFDSFADRLCDVMSSWGIDPLIREMWPHAIRSAQKSPSTVQALSACRMEQERKWGLGTLEIPLSEICQTEEFLMFLSHLILHAPRFHADYNRIVEDYRAANSIRNDRHPVPNLQQDGDAFELPFWFWKSGDTTRGQVFVHRQQQRIELISRGETILVSTPQDLVKTLVDVQQVGKLRTRALTTTLFSRLCLADQFIHGIGGAKYDEMTDRLIVEFFGEPAPHFLVLSATSLLSIPSFNETEEACRELSRKLRDLKYNADRHLAGPQVEALRQQKQELIRRHWAAQTEDLSKQERRQHRSQNRLRHAELKRVNEELTALAAEQIQSVQQELASCQAHVAANQVLASREFPAAIFPEPMIKQLAGQISELAMTVSEM